MIHFSFSSVLMTVVVSNLLLILISLFFRNEELLAKIGYKVMAVFCVVTLARLLFPYELPFTKTMAFPTLISDAISLLRFQHEIIPGFPLSISNVFCVVWFVGGMFFLFNQIRDQLKLRTAVMGISKNVTGKEPYASILRALCPEKTYRRLRLRTSGLIGSPMIIGLRKPIILLPEGMTPSDTDLLFALRHELYHYQHHDLWLKFFVSCLSTFYWWNPFCRRLNKQVGALMEMRVDASIAAEGDEAIAEYVTALIHYLENVKNHIDPSSHTMGLTFSKKSSLMRRVQMMQSQKSKPNYLISVALLLLVFGMYIGSYLIIFENSSYARDIKESGNYILPENADYYAVPNADGTYTVYILNGRYSEIVDSLDYYPNIVVYSSKEEYDETVQKNQ